MKKEWAFTLQFLLVASAVLFFNDVAMAITAPAAGSFAYDLYDVAVNKIVKGPIGYVGGVIAIAAGAWFLIQSKIGMALPAVLGGAAFLKADTITQTMGVIV